MSKMFLFFVAVFLVLPQLLFAQSLPSDINGSVDIAKLVGEIISNPAARTAAFLGCFFVLLIVQALKSPVFASFFKNIPPKVQLLVITILGQVYAFVLHVSVIKDQDVSVAIMGFISTGGAVAIFNVIKMFFEKPKQAA